VIFARNFFARRQLRVRATPIEFERLRFARDNLKATRDAGQRALKRARARQSDPRSKLRLKKKEDRVAPEFCFVEELSRTLTDGTGRIERSWLAVRPSAAARESRAQTNLSVSPRARAC
jgi:hypothetical protein